MSNLVFKNDPPCWQKDGQILLQLQRQHDSLYDIRQIHSTLLTQHADEIAKELQAFLRQHQAEGRLLEPPATADWRDSLLSLGLPFYQKLLYSRDLSEPLPALPKDYALESLAEIGETDFIAGLERAFVGDPESELQAPDWNATKELAELKDHADTAYDPQNWYRVRDDQQAIGMLLPQIYCDKPSEGTVFYLGVFAEHRHQGHGKALHLLGLHLLQQRGASRYLGSTHLGNQHMQQIFKANHCQQTRLLTFINP